MQERQYLVSLEAAFKLVLQIVTVQPLDQKRLIRFLNDFIEGKSQQLLSGFHF